MRPEEKTQEKGDGEEEEQEEEEEETTIPGSSYTKLMIMVDSIKVLESKILRLVYKSYNRRKVQNTE